MSFTPRLVSATPRLCLAALTLALLPPQAGTAQTVLSGDHSVDGGLCAGDFCTNSESVGGTFNALLLKQNVVAIDIEDTSDPSVAPSTDWSIEFNNGSAGKMAIVDRGDVGAFNTQVFTIEGNSRQHAMYLDNEGNLGLGTSMPSANLHIEDSLVATLQLRRNTSGGRSFQNWAISSGDGADVGNGALFFDGAAQTGVPLIIKDAALNNALVLGEGRIGMGTRLPQAALHVTRSDNTAGLLVEDSGASGAQEMLKLSNNGGSYFTFENAAAGTTWFFTHEDASPNRFIIADAVADGPEFTLTAGGDVTIPGNFISGATTLNVPDYVFADDYALRPLSEVQAFIDTHSHLPDVPSAADIAKDGLDMTAMQMTMLKKIEELTLYTLELEAANQAQATELARLGTLETRLARIEAALAAE
ncbi:hypothetical protein ACOXXX_18350 [Thalassococcus sp. BH17M4-6]|uniref:hypothetical protein n=1 Tax=Thalassococcus sp. BH17M4-6 TaxID=3413148 RepID=UPI003BE363D9